MKTSLVLPWIAAACGDDASSNPDASVADGALDPVDPDASLCDDGTDGLCADPQLCSADPNCMLVDAPPSCTPATLPPEPQNLLAGTTGLWGLRDVAAAGNTVFAAGIRGGAVVQAKVISCPATGCPATPATVGAIGGDPYEGFLAAFDGKVFWASHSTRSCARTSTARRSPR